MTLTAAQNAVYQYTVTVAELAYIYGYALITLWIMMSSDVNNKIGFNQMYYATGLSTPTYTPFTGPNVDTLYATAWLDLTNTPVLLTTPDTRQQNRWYTVQLLDIYSNTFYNAPGLEKNQPSKQYLILGPDWDYEEIILPSGATLVNATSNIVYLVSRTEVIDDDVTTALSVMHQITIQQVIPEASVLQIATITNTTDVITTLDFFVTLMQILNYNLPTFEEPILDLFNSVGLNPNTTFSPSSLPSYTEQAFSDAIPLALDQIIPFGYQYAYGIVYVGPWEGGTLNGAFGYDYLRRAFASYSGPAANLPQEQFYITTTTDSSLVPLDGATSNYVVHFDAGTYPDVNSKWGFWSLTVYTLPGGLYSNSYNIYGVGTNNNDLVYNSDGSLDIFVQNVQPTGSNPAYANFIPCPAEGFRLLLRMYAASDSQIENPSNLPSVLVSD